MKKEGRLIGGGRGQQSGSGDGEIYESGSQEKKEIKKQPKQRFWLLELFGADREHLDKGNL